MVGLLLVLAFGAMTAVDRIQAWTIATWPPSHAAHRQRHRTGRHAVHGRR